MKDINEALYNIRKMDEIGQNNTFIHNIDGRIKIIITLIYIIKVISLKDLNIRDMVILLAYPLMIFIVGRIPFKFIIKKLIIVLPIIFCTIIVNLLIDNSFYQVIKSIILLVKAILTLIAGVLLIASTNMDNIAQSLAQFKVPKIFIMQLMMIYRYIVLMLEEAYRIKNAYSLRSNNKSIQMKDFGVIIGHMLLRSIDRGENIYLAMKMRGFNGEYNANKKNSIKYKDILYLIFWSFILILS